MEPGEIALLPDKILDICRRFFDAFFLFHHGMSEEACRMTFSVALFIITAGTFVAQVIVGMRVYALYGRPRYMLILQASSIVISLVLVCVVQVNTERHVEYKPLNRSSTSLMEKSSLVS